MTTVIMAGLCYFAITHANVPRLLGTPTDNNWPGITNNAYYPDFKPSFPQWKRDYHKPLCTNLNDHGLDLLESMLAYDPIGRISAKQACTHSYFQEESAA